MIEQVGNCVKIRDTLIPALNIQVDGFPRYISREDGSYKVNWFGIYFEVLFETGFLWVVDQGSNEWKPKDPTVNVIVYEDAMVNEIFDIHKFSDWDEFLDAYKDAMKVRPGCLLDLRGT